MAPGQSGPRKNNKYVNNAAVYVVLGVAEVKRNYNPTHVLPSEGDQVCVCLCCVCVCVWVGGRVHFQNISQLASCELFGVNEKLLTQHISGPVTSNQGRAGARAWARVRVRARG